MSFSDGRLAPRPEQRWSIAMLAGLGLISDEQPAKFIRDRPLLQCSRAVAGQGRAGSRLEDDV